MSRLRFTHHAIEQFAARHGGTEAELYELAFDASPTRNRTPKGDEIWITAGGIRLVVKRDPGRPDPVCATILPLEDLGSSPDLTDPWADDACDGR